VFISQSNPNIVYTSALVYWTKIWSTVQDIPEGIHLRLGYKLRFTMHPFRWQLQMRDKFFLTSIMSNFLNICHVLLEQTIFSAQSFRGFISYNMRINEKSYRCVGHTNIRLGNSVHKSCSILERSTAVITVQTSVSMTGSLMQQATVL